MSKLLKSLDGEELPPLQGEQEYYVVWCYLSGVKRTVVERAQNILSLEEAKAHERECNKAMLDELTRWLSLHRGLELLLVWKWPSASIFGIGYYRGFVTLISTSDGSADCHGHAIVSIIIIHYECGK